MCMAVYTHMLYTLALPTAVDPSATAEYHFHL